MGWHFRIHEKQKRILGHHDDGREIALGVIGQFRIGGGDHREARGHHQQRVAVRRGFCSGIGSDEDIDAYVLEKSRQNSAKEREPIKNAALFLCRKRAATRGKVVRAFCGLGPG